MTSTTGETHALIACEECGTAVVGVAGCQKLFEQVLAKEFGDLRYARLHRLTVDTYSLQHPQRYMRSGKSFAAHITGMYAALDSKNAQRVNPIVQRWLDGTKSLERPAAPPPGQRGELTIVYLLEAMDASEHFERVEAWARSTWAAWRAYHSLAKKLIDRALAEIR